MIEIIPKFGSNGTKNPFGGLSQGVTGSSEDINVLTALTSWANGYLSAITPDEQGELGVPPGEFNAVTYSITSALSKIQSLISFYKFDADVTYEVGDQCFYNNKIWEALEDNSNSEPSDSNPKWELKFDLTALSKNSGVIVNSIEDFPTPSNNNITLADNTAYIIVGTVNAGINSITYGNNSSLLGNDILTSKLIFEGTGSKLITRNQSLYLRDLFITCDSGELFEAIDIDYLINPAVDPFQGRSKFFRVINCVLFGGVAGNGSDVGYIEGFATTNFNNNVVRNWDIGLKASNGLSLEATANKSVLWNQQGADMITLRADNWSNQPNDATGYIPTGINALIITGNILHPKNNEFAWKVEIGHNTAAGTISGNTFILTDNTTGGILNPTGQDYNDLANFTIKNNQGGIDNTALIQSYIDPNGTAVDTQLTQDAITKLDFNNLILSSNNLFFSQRILVNSIAGFAEQDIITGQTSGNTAKIRSIDIANNYLYVDYIVNSSNEPAQFTINEQVIIGNISTQYNGIDGTWRYSGNRAIQCEVLGNFSLEKNEAGSNETYILYLYKNDTEVVPLRKKMTLSNNENNQATISGVFNLIKDDIIEIRVANINSNDNVRCQGMNIVFSER
jgi:hypothetical protein